MSPSFCDDVAFVTCKLFFPMTGTVQMDGLGGPIFLH